MTPQPPESDDLSITFGLFGSDDETGRARVRDLANCLQHLEKCLHSVERCIVRKRPALKYVVQDLRIGSAICTLRASAPKHGRDPRRDVASVFRRTIGTLQSGDVGVDPRLDNPALEALRLFGKVFDPRGNPRARCRIIVDGTELNHQFIATVEKALEAKESSFGSVSGTLEKIDVHDKYQFAIYPAIGDQQVVCTFDESLLSEVRDALKRTVTVYGKAYFSEGSLLPQRMHVTEIEIHAQASASIDCAFRDLVGKLAIPGDSVSLVRKLRDEWEE